MRTLIEIIKIEFKEDLQYTFAFMMSIIVQPIILLINIALFTSVYAYNNTSQILGYDLGQMIWYMTSAHFIWVIVFNFADYRISDRVLSGDLNMDLLRPLSLFKYELGIAIGLRVTAFFTELIPGLIVFSIIYFPSFMSGISVVKFCVSILFSFLIMYMLNFLTGLTAFKLQNNASITGIKVILMSILGGSAIPLEFFPVPIRQVLMFLPFEYIFYWPIQFFLNTQSSHGLSVFVRTIGIQTVWVVLLYGLCRWFWHKASRNFSAVG